VVIAGDSSGFSRRRRNKPDGKYLIGFADLFISGLSKSFAARPLISHHDSEVLPRNQFALNPVSTVVRARESLLIL
jgi:hypothetical protein